jgi:hypothetical protein
MADVARSIPINNALVGRYFGSVNFQQYAQMTGQ